jgi:beta-galactosidase
VVRHGNAVTLGAWSPSLIREVISGLLAERGIPHEPLPEGARVARRGELATWMNFNEAPVTLPDGALLGPVSFELRAS